MNGLDRQRRIEPTMGRMPPGAPALRRVESARMDDTRRRMLYDARSKSALVAYLLWFFLGQVAAHRFYMGHTGVALAWLAVAFVSFVLTFVLVGVLGFVILGLWWLVDGVRLAGMVHQHNERVAYEL